jgi:ubiquinone/menaquinone biosynthesis C-methylase UbiE
LRQREQARAIVNEFSKSGSKNFAELVKEPHFSELKIYEPGIVGPFIKHLSSSCHYTESYFWENAKKETWSTVEFQDLMALSYPTESFDLVITCEVFEHIRKPYIAF